MLKSFPTWDEVGKLNHSKHSILSHNNLNKNFMALEVITREDLNEFRTLLLNDIKTIVGTATNSEKTKQWLKSKEVRALLNISPGTLQNLRINGTLTYTKIGGLMYYDQSDIQKVLNHHKVNATPTLFK